MYCNSNTSYQINFNYDNINEFNKLPYIQVNKDGKYLKFLIDSAATNSFLNPKIVKKYFQDNTIFEPFVVKSVHQITKHNNAVIIPAPKEFNLKKY